MFVVHGNIKTKELLTVLKRDSNNISSKYMGMWSALFSSHLNNFQVNMNNVQRFFGKHIVWGVLFPVGKHMRGGAENNEASPRHLPDLLPRKYNTPPGLLPPLPQLYWA